LDGGAWYIEAGLEAGKWKVDIIIQLPPSTNQTSIHTPRTIIQPTNYPQIDEAGERYIKVLPSRFASLASPYIINIGSKQGK